MTDAQTAATSLQSTRSVTGRTFAGPPAVLFFLVVVAAILLALDTNSRDSLGGLLLSVPVWLLLAAVWLARFVWAISRTKGRMRASHWARWLAIPIALGLVFAVTRTDAVKQARFDLSRSALDEMAADVMNGGPLDRGWVGMYNVGTVERTTNGFRFVIDDSGLSRWGLAYSPEGEPKESEDNYSELWTGATFEQLDGRWWVFWQEWD
jgi:hypothetical protein